MLCNCIENMKGVIFEVLLKNVNKIRVIDRDERIVFLGIVSIALVAVIVVSIFDQCCLLL